MYSILNFYERTVALLAAQFAESLANGGKTNFQKFLAAMVAPCYDINTVELELYNQRWIGTAVGVQLDEIGIILGLQRQPGQTDSAYREQLYFQVFINKSTATPEEMIFALKFLTKANKVHYFEPYPAFFQMWTNGLPENFSIPPDEIVTAIHSISPAGVQYAPITWYYLTDKGFGFSGDPIVEDFYVAPNPLDLTQLNPFHVSPDGIADDIFQINRGQTVTNPNFGGFAEDNFVAPNQGRLAEVLVLNGEIPPNP
jgi:hypothetical protein